ncbi:thiolase family protein [Rhizorhabdus wittichii]|uniref:thiolase family protein n=1 Tax=Rhizorhabdus wittichii TaxID=160791 RepID=UPI000300B447|nr:thiolase family protein [Rhizorhabdus wittichii]
MQDSVYVAGVGMTRFALLPGRTVKQLVREAVSACLDDAGARAADVEAAFFANVGQGLLEGQTGTPGQMALRPLGFQAIPIVNVENACASGMTALHLGMAQVRAGMADIVLAIGAEKLSVEDVAKRDALFAGGMDVHDRDAAMARLAALGAGTSVPLAEGERSVFMDMYGCWARAHMADFGTTRRQLAAIAAKNHGHSVDNPYCQFRRAFTVDEVLAARSLSYPLTVPMCSPYSDGAAAALLCSAEGLRRLGDAARAGAVRIAASVLQTGSDRDDRDWDRHVTRLAADRAYDQAGIGPDAIDLAEVHDATAFGELLNVENLRLAARGEGGPAAERGDFTLGGRVPVNVSGGLESRGHPLAATGLAQIHELVTQLRGRAGPRQVAGARHAMLENGGGLYGVEDAAAAVAILAAPGA